MPPPRCMSRSLQVKFRMKYPRGVFGKSISYLQTFTALQLVLFQNCQTVSKQDGGLFSISHLLKDILSMTAFPRSTAQLLTKASMMQYVWLQGQERERL